MVSKSIKVQRCNDVLAAFMEGAQGCVFFTLTTPDVVDIHDIRQRWRDLRHWFMRQLPKGTKYVMNFEIHPGGHGWHIHSVFNCYIDLKRFLPKIRECGFGRVDVRRVNSQGVADYLTKHALKAYRGVSRREMSKDPSFRLRLVNTSRGLPTLDSYAWFSDHKEQTRHLLKLTTFDDTLRRLDFVRRYQACELASMLGVRHTFELHDLVRSMLFGSSSLAFFISSFKARSPAVRPVEQMEMSYSTSRTGKALIVPGVLAPDKAEGGRINVTMIR